MAQKKPSTVEMTVEGKRDKLREAKDEVLVAELVAEQPADLRALTSLYDQYDTGRLVNVSSNRFSWIPPGPEWDGPDIFEYIPRTSRPFRFIPPNGRSIEPRRMFTDIGTIPRLAGVFSRGLTAWGYAPAYIVHDWEYELHHCGLTNKTFEQVNDTMMQCLKTLMENEVVPVSRWNFWLVYQGITSSVARRYWNRNPPKCTLPPDHSE